VRVVITSRESLPAVSARRMSSSKRMYTPAVIAGAVRTALILRAALA
jgi:hypothetical protein